MINPYSSYIVAFIFALLAYGLGWSDLYPPISTELIGFLSLTIILHLTLSFYWKSRIITPTQPSEVFLNPVLTTIFIYSLWTLDFVYEGGIPLVKILLNQPYNYRLFGFPSIHVFTVTFASFFTVYLFTLFISSRKQIYINLYLINLFAALLIYSRAMLIFNIVASAFVYLLLSTSFSWKRVGALSIGFIALLFFFGVLGSLRVSFEAKEKYNPDLFLVTGQASTSFRKSWVPREFFWGYIYVSSPLANLQQNINTFNVPPFSISRTAQHINNEMLFDFISKRINKITGIEREKENPIPQRPFNVSTVYSRSFSYQGWVGMFTIAAFILILPLVYVRLLPVNSYQLTGIAILNTMYLFLFYDNTIRFTGLGLQLVYPFLLPLTERGFRWFQKKAAL
jgi:hypothetical protein